MITASRHALLTVKRRARNTGDEHRRDCVRADGSQLVMFTKAKVTRRVNYFGESSRRGKKMDGFLRLDRDGARPGAGCSIKGRRALNRRG